MLYNSAIQQKAEEQWLALPANLRLGGSLKHCTRTPFDRDFLAHARLQHLHVLFLLRLLLLNTMTEPDIPIIETAGQMLALVVECILLRDQLTNSGTGLIWKVGSLHPSILVASVLTLILLQVAYYGLPAAGIILLALLKQHTHTTQNIARTKILQDLSVFVAEVQIGTIVRPGDPNYALLSKATQTIQRFLDSFHSDSGQAPTDPGSHEEGAGNDDWAALLSQDLWDFEAGFWQSLADHPALLAVDPPLPRV